MTTPTLYLLETRPEHRRGRARYWRPNGAGYTDHLWDAGLFTNDSPEACRTERAELVEALPVLEAEVERVEAEAKVKLDSLLEMVGRASQ